MTNLITIWRGKFLYFLIQGFSCYHARLRAGIFKFSRAPQAVLPVQKKEALIQALLLTTLGLRSKVSGPQSRPFFSKTYMNLYRVLSVFRFHQNHNSIQEADCHFILLELIADTKAVIWYQCMIRQWILCPFDTETKYFLT